MRVLMVLVLLLFMFVVPASAAEKQWVELTTDVDTDGNIVTTKVFGYYADVKGFGQVFVVCDPNTGEETGNAFVPNAKVGEKKVQVLTKYDKKQIIDFNQLKVLRPPQVSIIAPNIPTRRGGWNWEWFRETGQFRHKMDGIVSWPDNYSWEYLVPDPSCWLIVLQVTNPNPFAITAEVSGQLSYWKDDGYYYEGKQPYLSVNNKIVDLEAGETKYILMWSGNPPDEAVWLLRDWEDDYYWSDSWLNGKVVKNFDPELPDACQPDVAFYPRLYGWNSVSELLPFYYRFDIDAQKGNQWSANGVLKWGEDGKWHYTPGRHEEYRPEVASVLENIFNRRAFKNIEWTHWEEQRINKKIDGVYFEKIYDSDGRFLASHGGPVTGASGPGPVLSAILRPAGNSPENRPRIRINSEPGSVVGWSKEIPVLKRQAVFVNRYTFIPTESSDVGMLAKQTVPAYLFWVDDIRRPYFQESTTVTNIRVERARYRYRSWYVDTWEYRPGRGWSYQGQIRSKPKWLDPYIREWWRFTDDEYILDLYKRWISLYKGDPSRESISLKEYKRDMNKRGWWRFTVNLLADIDVVNPSNVPVTFSRTKEWWATDPRLEKIAFHPACGLAARRLAVDRAKLKWSASPNVWFTDKKQIDVDKQTTKNVLKRQPVTIIGVANYRYSPKPKDVLNWASTTLLRSVSWKREAYLYLWPSPRYSAYHFSIKPTEVGYNAGEHIVSLASATGRHCIRKKNKKKRCYFYLVGFVTPDGRYARGPFNTQFFNKRNPTGGTAVAPSDAIYTEILQHMFTTVCLTETCPSRRLPESHYRFWPVYD